MDISLINQCIASLILDSNKLVIPELGALLRKHLPNGKEKITFSTLLRYNDGILQKAIETARDLTQEESALVLKLYVNHVRKAVESKNGFTIPQVGVLKIDELKDIVLIDENAQTQKVGRIPRRVADIDIAEDTEVAVPLKNEDDVQLAKAKANRLDDLQARLSKLNAAKETSIRHLRDVVEPEQQEPTIGTKIRKSEGVEVILEGKIANKEEIKVVLFASKKADETVATEVAPIVEESVEEQIFNEEVNSVTKEDLPKDDVLLHAMADEKKKSHKTFWIWMIIALLICGLSITGFVKSDQVEKLWKGSVMDRWFWNLVEPMTAKIDKVVVVKPQEAAAVPQETPVPVISSNENSNADLVFEEGVFYIIAGSYSTKEGAQKGIVALKNDPKLKIMPFERGRVKYVLVSGKYEKEEEARTHLKEWEGSWILWKPLKK